MTETRKFHCIICPRGCGLTVKLEDGKFQSVTGNSCPNGAKYAEQEVNRPMRTLTGTVALEGGALPLLPVYSSGPVPKAMLLRAAEELRRVTAHSPVKCGEPVLRNLLGLGVDVLASNDM